MDNFIKSSSLTTKFISVLIVNFILAMAYYMVAGYIHSGVPVFNIERGSFVTLFHVLFYSLFFAKIWEILEKDKNCTVRERIKNITISAIFVTMCDIIAHDNVTAEKMKTYYITVPIEIFLVFVLETIISFLGKKEKVVKQIAKTFNFCMNFFIFAIVIACFITWTPASWEILPLKILWHITGPYMVLFNNIFPAIAGIDFSPIFAIIILEFVKKQANRYFNGFISVPSTDEEDKGETEDASAQ